MAESLALGVLTLGKKLIGHFDVRPEFRDL